MTQYMDELSKKAADLSAKINLTNTAMINLELPPPLKQKISKYIYNTHTTNNLQTDMEKFLRDLRPELKSQVEKTSFMIVIEQNYVMRALLKKRTDDIYEQSILLQKTTMRNSKKRF